jgi:hypothetical protein
MGLIYMGKVESVGVTGHGLPLERKSLRGVRGFQWGQGMGRRAKPWNSDGRNAITTVLNPWKCSATLDMRVD